MDLTELFEGAGPSVLAFISKWVQTGLGGQPLFPPIFGTGFFVSKDGIAITNRHVVEIFNRVQKHPQTGDLGIAALMFLSGAEDGSWQMLALEIKDWHVLGTFSSSDRWFGNQVPDVGFVQVAVREVPFLTLATEDYYLKIGMEVGTIGYPMGTLPLTALGKLNQVSPFVRHGVVSSVFPFPTANPHGFTIDIMQQGGSSGSPIFRKSDGQVIGMMSSGMMERKTAQSEEASLAYTTNTNISIAEPARILQGALDEYMKNVGPKADGFPSLKDLRDKHPLGSVPEDLTWESFRVQK